jgi:hypothetical protein
MSLVISNGFGFDRITCVYTGSASRKSTESSSKTSRKGEHLRAALMGSVFLTLKTAEKRLVAARMQSEREQRRRRHEMVAGRRTAKKNGEWTTASGDYGCLFAMVSGPGARATFN